jgi:hypothetical protein
LQIQINAATIFILVELLTVAVQIPELFSPDYEYQQLFYAMANRKSIKPKLYL